MRKEDSLCCKEISSSPAKNDFSYLEEWKENKIFPRMISFIAGAAHNYNYLYHEAGAYAHNSNYAKRFVFDSIDGLTIAIWMVNFLLISQLFQSLPFGLGHRWEVAAVMRLPSAYDLFFIYMSKFFFTQVHFIGLIVSVIILSLSINDGYGRENYLDFPPLSQPCASKLEWSAELLGMNDELDLFGFHSSSDDCPECFADIIFGDSQGVKFLENYSLNDSVSVYGKYCRWSLENGIDNVVVIS